MNQTIDISIPRLSAPVQALKIDRRASRSLQHASLYTVAEVLLAGRPNLDAVNKIGVTTARRVFEALAGYLGLSEEQLLREVSLKLENGYDAWDAPIQALEISSPTLASLESIGLSRIHQLVQARANQYDQLLGLGMQEVDDIDRALSRHMARVAQAYLAPVLGKRARLDAPVLEHILQKDLGSTLAACRFPPHTWATVELRVMRCMSLRAIGSQTGNTREGRVFMTLQQAHQCLRRKLKFLGEFFDRFEAQARLLQRTLGEDPLELKDLVHHLASTPLQTDLHARERDVEQVILLLRSMTLRPSAWFPQEVKSRWPALIFLSCLVRPVIIKHPQVRELALMQGWQDHLELSNEAVPLIWTPPNRAKNWESQA